jgi:hypothetical protein
MKRTVSRLEYDVYSPDDYYEEKDDLMAYAWNGIGKSPITLFREELTRRFIKSREVDHTLLNYTILLDIDDERQELSAGVLYRENNLFFMVDLVIDCPDDVEILANVAGIAYDMYTREEPYYGRLLIKDGKTYYQLCHILGPSGMLDPAMAGILLDLVLKEVLEVIGERYSME